MQETEQLVCIKCGQVWKPHKDDYYWDEKGYGYSAKLCNCPECNTPKIIKYYEDHGLDLNKDTRWF